MSTTIGIVSLLLATIGCQTTPFTSAQDAIPSQEAMALLARASGIYRAALTFHSELDTSLRIEPPVGTIPAEKRYVWWKKGGRLRSEFPAKETSDGRIEIWDGTLFIQYKPALGIATRTNLPSTPQYVLDILGNDLFSLDRAAVSAQAVGKESIDEGGTSYDCEVVKVTYSYKNVGTYENETTFWIGSTTGLLWRAESKLKPTQFGGVGFTGTERLDFASQELNQPVDAEIGKPLPASTKILDEEIQSAPRMLLPNTPAPDWRLPTVAGGLVGLDDFKGQVRVLVFWATWSNVSRDALPRLFTALRLFRDKGVVPLAINVGESSAKVRAFLATTKFDCTVLLADQYPQIMGDYVIQSIPTVVLVDRNGRTANIVGGTGSAPDPVFIAEAVAKLLKQ